MIETQLRGIPFAVHENDALSGAILQKGDFWESDILDYLRDNYPVQKVILDIGANIGNHSVYFANFMKYDAIIGFEPIHENYELLVKNMAYYQQVGLVRYAVSDHTGTVYMAKNLQNFGAHEVRINGVLEVPSITVDRFTMMDEVSLIKIDAEWHEPQVLDGASDTLHRWHPLVLIEDTSEAYGMLFPEGYELIASWKHHNTYLYEWVEH